MACTIVSTPATGATDWTDWITQQGLTDRGFSRVSLTNFAGTAASAIGTGSVFELAGSIYNNTTETAISLATGTASASVAVYILAIPAAGGTTCTFELDSIAPTWIDAKQGFYASAASTTRALGGMYIGTAATYYVKYIYTPDMLGYLLSHGGTRPLRNLIVNLGEWNMQSTASLIVPTGIPRETIRQISAIISDDAGTAIYDLVGTQTIQADEVFSIRMRSDTAFTVTLDRDTGGWFDSASFNGTASTVANRGYVNIEHIA